MRSAIQLFSSWTGFPFNTPERALGCSRKRGLCHSLIVSTPQIPGQISFLPPEKPAMKCGSIKPTVIFTSDSIKCLFTQMGTWRGLIPRNTSCVSSCPSWLITLYVSAISSPSISTISLCVLALCKPVAMRIVMDSSGTPAADNSARA